MASIILQNGDLVVCLAPTAILQTEMTGRYRLRQHTSPFPQVFPDPVPHGVPSQSTWPLSGTGHEASRPSAAMALVVVVVGVVAVVVGVVVVGFGVVVVVVVVVRVVVVGDAAIGLTGAGVAK